MLWSLINVVPDITVEVIAEHGTYPLKHGLCRLSQNGYGWLESNPPSAARPGCASMLLDGTSRGLLTFRTCPR